MKEYIPLFESALKILKTKRKSDDISALFFSIKIPTPSLINDFFIEFALAADSEEKEGVGCYNLDHLEKALQEVKETGSTDLLNKPRD